MIVVALLASVSVAQAQKVFKPTTILNGKTIYQMAKEYDVQIYLSTATIYKAGMSESAFVSELLNNFPKEANGYKDLCVPYFKYIYSFHKRGLSESQAQSSVTGAEFASLATNLSSWNANNPGQIADSFRINWKMILEAFVAAAQVIITFL